MLASKSVFRSLPVRLSILKNYRGMASAQPKDGSSLTGRFKVLESDLASAISPEPSDNYAKVLATPRVIGFMEIVAARMLIPYLAPERMSVGVRVDMMHTAATQVNEEVSVTATFLRKEGKLFVFDLVANDAGGEIGKARHERAIIDESRLMSGAAKRAAGSSKM
jgi:predicted thioesterase